MRLLLYIVLGILALNLLVILMVALVLLSDWIRNRRHSPAIVRTPGPGSGAAGDRGLHGKITPRP